MRRWKVFLISIFLCSSTDRARAQFIGYVSPQTVAQRVFNAVGTAQASGCVPNVGQVSHEASYVTSGTITRLGIQIEGSNDLVNFIRISETATNTTSGAVYATGYLPCVRINITQLAGGGTLTVNYAGTSTSIASPAGVFAQSGTNLQILASALPANASQTFTVNLPAGGTAGTLYFNYTGANPAGGTVAVNAGYDTNHLASVLAAQTIAASTSVQTFQVPSTPANVAQVIFSSPGATVATYDLAYQFGGSQVSVSIQASQGPANPSNIAQFGGTNVVTGVGASGVGVPRVTVSNDSQVIATGSVADGVASTTNSVSVAGTSPAGLVRTLGVLTTETDATANAVNNEQLVQAHLSLFNGTTWDRERSATGTTGILAVSTEGAKATYRAATNFSPTATAATDIFVIGGSGTRTVRVNHVGVACTATAAIASDILILKRSTADTAGTAVTAVAMDSTDAAATATVNSYTANPTTGTLVGNISDDKASITATTGAPQFYFEDFTVRNGKGLVLRGTAQQLAINLNGASIAGIACAAEVEWTEE